MEKEQGLIDGANVEAGDVAAQNTIDNGVSDADIEKLWALGSEIARLSNNGEVSTLNIARENLAEREKAEQIQHEESRDSS